MRKIITTTFLTLDGVMQAPGASDEDKAEGFNYGGWQLGFDWGKEADDILNTRIENAPYDLLLGRVTYEIFAAHWPNYKDEPNFGKPFNAAKKFVVSHKSVDLTWDKSELITGNVVAELKKLKASDGPNLVVWGSGKLIQTLLVNNLVDRMHIFIYPVTIGTGKKLFAEGTQPERFKVVDSAITPTGVMFATYEPSTSLK